VHLHIFGIDLTTVGGVKGQDPGRGQATGKTGEEDSPKENKKILQRMGPERRKTTGRRGKRADGNGHQSRGSRGG